MATSRAGVVIPALLVTCWFYPQEVWSQCSKQDYQYCVKLADPLLKDPHLIYPDNPKDIENVCRTWSYFVDCVKQYTDRCFTETRKKEFNRAVENPVNSIHKLCSMPDYRDDYMKHASCMKMTLTQDDHCGRHYRLLVSQVSGEAARSSICCSHHLFRECVLDQTRNSCDSDAEAFSAQMLDKALSFLREQCSNFVPNQVDCPGSEFYKVGRSDMSTMMMEPVAETRPMMPTSSTKTSPQPWMPSSDPRGTSTKVDWNPGPSQQPSNMNNNKNKVSSPSWLPGRGRSSDAAATVTSETIASGDDASRRASSYGRGMTWPDSPTPPSTWRVSGSYESTWYPSSKSKDTDLMMKENAIDEPNQQGLEGDSGATSILSNHAALATSLSLALLAILNR